MSDTLSVIVDNFDLFRTSVRPLKYDSPLIVYANRVLSREIAPQCFQAVSRRGGEVAQQDGAVELYQLAASDLCDIRREPLRDASLLENQLGKRSSEAPDHRTVTYHIVIRNTRYEVCYGVGMGKSPLAKLRTLRQSIRAGEASGRPIPWDPDETKSMVRLRKALMIGLQGPDVDNFDIEKVKENLRKRRRRSSHRSD
jgi:hypothetical protein